MTGMKARTCQEFLGMPTPVPALSKATAHTCEAFWGGFESVASQIQPVFALVE